MRQLASLGALASVVLGLSACRGAAPHPPQSVGGFNPETGTFHLQSKGGGPGLVVTYGLLGDIPVVGDWDGDGVDTIGVYRDGVGFLLRNSNSSGDPDLVHQTGLHGRPLTGDWSPTGSETLQRGGVDQDGVFSLMSGADWAGPVTSFVYGDPGDVPFGGDWDGDGSDTIGVYRPGDGCFYLRNSNTTGFADRKICVGPGSPVTGDWDGDGIDTVAICDASGTLTIFDQAGGIAETRACDPPPSIPLAGQWAR